MGGLRQATHRQPRGCARLSRTLHPSDPHLEPAADRLRRVRRHLPLQGLSPHTCPERQQVITLDTHEFMRVILPETNPSVCRVTVDQKSAPSAGHRSQGRSAILCELYDE